MSLSVVKRYLFQVIGNTVEMPPGALTRNDLYISFNSINVGAIINIAHYWWVGHPL